MPKLPALKSKQVIKVLEKAGFAFARQKGSHAMYVKENLGVTIPIHNKELKKGTLKSIIKQSGMTVDEFVELL